MAPTVTQPPTYTRPMDPYHYHRPDHDEKRDTTAAQAECTFGFDDDSEREPPCRHEHGPKLCRRRTTRLGLIILFLLLGLVAFLVVGWSPFLASAFGLGGGNGGGHAYDAVEVKNVLGFLVGRAVLDATGQPSAAADGSGTLIDRKYYIVIIIAGLVLVLLAGIMLSVCCCKSVFKNPICCPCYLCACCGGLACLECIGCGLCAAGAELV